MRPSPLLLVAIAVSVLIAGIIITLVRQDPGPSASATAQLATPGASSPVAPSIAPVQPSALASATLTTPGGSPQYQSPTDLAIGDCFDPIEDANDGTLLAALLRPCGEPHLREVFGVADLPDAQGTDFPGISAVDAAAETLCDGAFTAYVGIAFDASRYGYFYYTPTRATWGAGDRAVLCAIDDEGRPLVGSVRGTAQ